MEPLTTALIALVSGGIGGAIAHFIIGRSKTPPTPPGFSAEFEALVGIVRPLLGAYIAERTEDETAKRIAVQHLTRSPAAMESLQSQVDRIARPDIPHPKPNPHGAAFTLLQTRGGLTPNAAFVRSTQEVGRPDGRPEEPVQSGGTELDQSDSSLADQ